jgi:DNA polymerase/3'-5' exonuclease PolX
MRHYAKARGYSLSDHGIVHATKVGSQNIVRGTENLFPAESEQQIFEKLGLEYVMPEMRNTDIKEISKPVLTNGAVNGATGRLLTHRK